MKNAKYILAGAAVLLIFAMCIFHCAAQIRTDSAKEMSESAEAAATAELTTLFTATPETTSEPIGEMAATPIIPKDITETDAEKEPEKAADMKQTEGVSEQAKEAVQVTDNTDVATSTEDEMWDETHHRIEELNGMTDVNDGIYYENMWACDVFELKDQRLRISTENCHIDLEISDDCIWQSRDTNGSIWESSYEELHGFWEDERRRYADEYEVVEKDGSSDEHYFYLDSPITVMFEVKDGKVTLIYVMMS